ncbi:hypothetical protein OG800_06080 [Streptomyces sp. NBC_00445]|uniref:hypothetical protein n=1 Tax=Streptomyces sp. NBC_00445 TaxID=2975745 RepID=UPI002E217FF7
MRAHDLAAPYPTVSADDALRAARLLVREQLPALLVLDRDDYPYAVVPSARVIGALLPWYMTGRSVTEWLPRRITPPVVERGGDKATLIGAVTATALLEHFIGGS